MRWLKRKIRFIGRKLGLVKRKPVTQRREEVEADIVNNKLYPRARFIPDLPKLKTNAKMRTDEYVIHHTAGHRKQKAVDFIKDFLKRGLCTDFMDHKGQIYIQRDHDRAGSHIGKAKLNGKSFWTKGIGGIEIASSGTLTYRNGKFYTWFNKEIPEIRVRKVTKAQGYNCEGYFEILDQKQERELALYLAWKKKRNPNMNFRNHSDISGYRGKTDLDGSLSLPLKEFVKQKVMPLVDEIDTILEKE